MHVSDMSARRETVDRWQTSERSDLAVAWSNDEHCLRVSKLHTYPVMKPLRNARVQGWAHSVRRFLEAWSTGQ